MSRNMASWKLLEDMMIALKKQGVAIPDRVVEDLRSSKSLIQLSCMEGSGDAAQKAEEYMASVEAFLANEAQKAFGSDAVDEWLRHLEEANVEPVCAKPTRPEEDKFVTGVPRDQKWVRIKPLENLSAERIKQMAKEANLQADLQNDGRLLVYGKPEDIKTFVNKMAAMGSRAK